MRLDENEGNGIGIAAGDGDGEAKGVIIVVGRWESSDVTRGEGIKLFEEAMSKTSGDEDIPVETFPAAAESWQTDEQEEIL